MADVPLLWLLMTANVITFETYIFLICLDNLANILLSNIALSFREQTPDWIAFVPVLTLPLLNYVIFDGSLISLISVLSIFKMKLIVEYIL